MSGIIRLKKGLDIPLLGKAKESIQKVERSETFSVRPDDFVGIKPKVIVKDGDQVKVGSVLFYSKMNPELKFVSPVSGDGRICGPLCSEKAGGDPRGYPL